MQGIYISGVLSVDIFLPVVATEGWSKWFSSMMEGSNHTIFWWHCVMAIPLQVKVCMSGFSVYCCTQTPIFIWYDQNVQKGHWTIWSWVFTGKLDMFIYRIDVDQKTSFVSCLDDGKGIINKSSPETGGVVMSWWLSFQNLPYKG